MVRTLRGLDLGIVLSGVWDLDLSLTILTSVKTPELGNNTLSVSVGGCGNGNEKIRALQPWTGDRYQVFNYILNNDLSPS